MKTINAYVHTSTGTKVVKIEMVAPELSESKLDELSRSFNRETRVIEFVGGVTYYFTKYRQHKSSSLEELFEMYKAHKLGLPIPERKCFFIKTKKYVNVFLVKPKNT